MTGLPVGFFDEVLYGFGGRKGPKDQGFEESKLSKDFVSELLSDIRGFHITRSTGVMLVNVPPPCVGFFPFHAAGHCD